MSMLCRIYNAIIKKLVDFKDVYKYTSNDKTTFDKFVGLLTKSSHHIYKSIEMYLLAIMLINIGIKYLTLVSVI